MNGTHLVESTLEIPIALEWSSPNLIELIFQIKNILDPFQSKGHSLCTSNGADLTLPFALPIIAIAHYVDVSIANLRSHGCSVNLLSSPRNRILERFAEAWETGRDHSVQAIEPAKIVHLIRINHDVQAGVGHVDDGGKV